MDQFLSWKLEHPNHFNQSMHIAIDSSITDDVLKRILAEIVIHHDMLRAVMKDGKVRILPVSESKLFELYTIDLSGADDPYAQLERKCSEIQSSMNLEEGPLVKALSFELEGQRYAAVFIHHLAIDGVSWRIIQEDFAAIASQLAKGEEVKLPHKTASFIDWSNSLKEFEQSREFEQAKSYWSGIAESLSEYVLSGGTDGGSDGIDSISVTFDEDETELIKKSVTAFNCGLLDIFLSAFAAAVEESIGFDRVSVLIEDNGRRGIHKEILTDRTVGWFTNTYPLIVGTYDDWDSTVIENKEALRAVPFDGMGFMSFNKNIIDTKRFVLFNYLGEFASENDVTDGSAEEISLGAGVCESDRLRVENDMVFNGAIASGKLSFDVSYRTSCFTENLMSQLSGSFRENLLELAEYCNSYGSTMYTASDFSDDLDSEDYDSILDLL